MTTSKMMAERALEEQAPVAPQVNAATTAKSASVAVSMDADEHVRIPIPEASEFTTPPRNTTVQVEHSFSANPVGNPRQAEDLHHEHIPQGRKAESSMPEPLREEEPQREPYTSVSPQTCQSWTSDSATSVLGQKWKPS